MFRQRAQLLLSRTLSVASTARNQACNNNNMKNANILPAHTSSSYCAVSSMSTSESTFSSSSSFWNTTTALIAATVAMAVVATPDYVSPNKTTDCCGIVDVIGTKDHPDVLPNQSIDEFAVSDEFIAGIIALSETAAGTVYDGDEVEVGSNNNNNDDDEFAVSDEFIAGIIALSETAAGNTTATTGRRSSRQCRQSQNKEDDDEDEYLSTNFTTTTTKSSKRKLVSSAIGDEEDDDDNEDFTKGKRKASRSRYVTLGESDDDDSDDDEDDGASYPDVDEDDDDDRIDDPIDADVYEETTTTDAVTSTTALNSVASTSVLTTTTMVSTFTKKNKNSNDKDAAVVCDDFVEGEDGDDEPALCTAESSTSVSTTTTVPCPECNKPYRRMDIMYEHFRAIHFSKVLKDGSCKKHDIPVKRVAQEKMPERFQGPLDESDYNDFMARVRTHINRDIRLKRYTLDQIAYLKEDFNKTVHGYGRQLLDVVIKRGLLNPGSIDDAGGYLHNGLLLPKYSGIHQLSLDRIRNDLPHFVLGESITKNLMFVALGMNTQANIVSSNGNKTCDIIRAKVKAGKNATPEVLNHIVSETRKMPRNIANKLLKTCSNAHQKEKKKRKKGSDNIEITNAMNKFHEQFPDSQSLYMHALKLYCKQKGRCAVSKIIMDMREEDGSNYYQVSLDAISPKKLHVKDNLQLVCRFINCTNMEKSKGKYDANDTSGRWTTKSLYRYIGYSA